MFERFFISKFKNCRLQRAEVHRVLWKIKEFVYFCGSVQPISLRTLVGSHLIFVHATVSSQELISDVSKWCAFARTVERKGVKVPGVNILKEKGENIVKYFKGRFHKTFFAKRKDMGQRFPTWSTRTPRGTGA